MAEMSYYNEWLTGACGVENCTEFQNASRYVKAGPLVPTSKPGVGLHVAGFVDTEECLTIYNEFKSQWKIAYQSEPRRNINSENMFIFVVFDDQQTTEGNDQYEFPWAGEGDALGELEEDYDF
jgi:hypothetical protein